MPRRAKSVGRWHTPGSNHISQSQAYDGFYSVSQPAQGNQMVSESLFSLTSSSSKDDSKKLVSLVSITDGEPFDYCDQLQAQFPNVSKMGIVAAKTPFVNYNPYTIFVNDEIYRGGAVTIAMHRLNTSMRNKSDPIGCISSDFIKHSGLYSISTEPLVITKCRGNIILEVDGKDQNASLLMVKQIHHDSRLNQAKIDAHDSSYGNKSIHENSIYAKLTDPKTGSSGLFPVVGGDLSKGALAIDTLMDIQPQTLLEFYRSYQNGRKIEVKSGISFSVVPDMESPVTSVSVSTHDSTSPHDDQGIVISSEEGIIISTPETLGGYQVSSIPFSVVSLDEQLI